MTICRSGCGTPGGGFAQKFGNVHEMLGRIDPALRCCSATPTIFQVMVQQIAACNAAHNIEERMCRWMLLTHDRVGRDEFPLMQECPRSCSACGARPSPKSRTG